MEVLGQKQEAGTNPSYQNDALSTQIPGKEKVFCNTSEKEKRTEEPNAECHSCMSELLRVHFEIDGMHVVNEQSCAVAIINTERI